MTVKELRDELNEVIESGNGDCEIAMANNIQGQDGWPLVEVLWFEKPTATSGLNIPFTDWPVCTWASEKHVYDFTGDEAKEIK